MHTSHAIPPCLLFFFFFAAKDPFTEATKIETETSKDSAAEETTEDIEQGIKEGTHHLCGHRFCKKEFTTSAANKSRRFCRSGAAAFYSCCCCEK
jgi:hypothetical protein